MTIQLLEDIIAICKNKDCEWFKGFETYEPKDMHTEDGKDFVICGCCKQRVYLD